MTRFCWWVVNRLSRLLQPEERDAVCGDLAELDITSGRALFEVFGLIVRRQASLWTEWRLWTVLAGLILPLGMLLSVISSVTANRSAIYVWMYADNWHWVYLSNPGFWYVLAGVGATVLLWYLALACASWTGGFVLGAASRRNLQSNGILLCLMLLVGGLVGVPLYWQFLGSFYQRVLGVPFRFGQDPVVFSLAFYRVIFPLMVQACLVVLPALWGMREGSRMATHRPWFRTVLWTAVALALAAVLFQAPGLVFFLKTFLLKSSIKSGLGNGWGIRLLQLAVYWPVAYTVATAGSQRVRRRAVLSQT